MSRIIASEQVFPVDIDGTLLLKGKIKKGDKCVLFTDPYTDEQFPVKIHTANVKVLNNRLSRGAHLLVWSANGFRHATAAVKALGLFGNPQITILSKPCGYLDDKECTEWMGDRVWVPEDDIYGT